MKRTLLTVVAAVLIVVTALPSVAAMAASNTDLTDTAWTLTGLPGVALLPEPQVTMQFADGRVYGTDGCNRYSAPYTMDGERLRLTANMLTTMMACPEPVMKQAEAFGRALSGMQAVRIDAGHLVLLDADGATLATLSPQDRNLPGTAWQVTGYNNGKQAVVSVQSGTTLTMAFTAEGTVRGSAGCNSYSADFSVAGKSISIGKIAATKKMCARPRKVMQQEAAFLQSLQRAAVVRVEGGRLELRSDDGALLVTAERETAAAPAAGGAGAAAIGAHGLRLPATFRGDLPCADCEGIRHHLDLWPDQVFHLHREWLGITEVRDDVGRWRTDPARGTLMLEAGGDLPLQYAIEGPGTIRQLAMDGKPIKSDLPYQLVSDGTLTPADLTLPLGGEMQYMADAARFTECLSGRSYPIVMEGDFISMERAYLDAVDEPGSRLYVTFEGSIVSRPKMDGDGVEPSIVVNRFINAWPGERCERAMADASLTNTYWRIVRLGNEPVRAAEGQREPHLLLRDDGERTSYAATVGCNRMIGGFTVDGARISIAPSASTKMACPPPLATLERQLAAALARTSTWRIEAGTLEFFDATNTSVALFQAVYL
jgi:heat shock protein HslJ/uncharacterized lipoprotein NlpE involved in copper resistance